MQQWFDVRPRFVQLHFAETLKKKVIGHFRGQKIGYFKKSCCLKNMQKENLNLQSSFFQMANGRWERV